MATDAKMYNTAQKRLIKSFETLNTQSISALNIWIGIYCTFMESFS
jgi:hypothetical protein